MKVIILNCIHQKNNPSGVNAFKHWISPDKRYIVAEVFRAGYYVAAKILEYNETLDMMTIDCIDNIDCSGKFDDDVYFVGHDVSWDCMEYGFFKLIFWNIENNLYRTFRFYFNPELYKQKYEEQNGIPYTGQKRFTHR